MAITICISHKEDVDGLSSAILISSVFKKVSVVLVDYANLVNKLEKLIKNLLPMSKGYNRIFICDLGLNKKNQNKFISSLGKMISLGYKVTYIDHHDLEEDAKKEIKKTGVNLIHSTEECTSVQVYKRFKKKLSSNASFFAAAGALTDYLDNKPIASSLISRYDRQFLMLESTAMSYMISSNQNNEDYLYNIVNVLSTMKFPHEIDGGFVEAEKYAKKISNAINSLSSEIKIKNNLALVQNNLDLASSTVVNFVLGVSEKKVAMVYKYKEEKEIFIISIRGSKDCNVHLGRTVNDIASELGGSGGGHNKACGAVIPKDSFNMFVELLDKKLSD
ncbi:MAG TPA: DHH family phosphoesterase [Nitrososphaeraceae archaeon]|jgi:RecJ-like exonuclease|nr:DHH family phosphoesterase [Nitrososphaeraceae archaeon]